MVVSPRKGKSLEEYLGKERADKIKKKLKGRNKGKTYEEIHGEKKAKEIKKKIVANRKGKNFEEFYGKERAKRIKNKLSKSQSKTYEEKYGKERANKIRKKVSRGTKGKTYEEIYGKEKGKQKKREMKIYLKKWSKGRIVENLANIIKKVGPITKSDINRLKNYYDICHIETIRQTFGSLDNLSIESNIQFKSAKGSIGSNEKRILDEIEKEKNIVLLRQFSIVGKYIDGYDRENNVAYEIDECYHKYKTVEDKIREDKIKAALRCEFIRVNS